MRITIIHRCEMPQEVIAMLEGDSMLSDLADHVGCAIGEKIRNLGLAYQGRDTTVELEAE